MAIKNWTTGYPTSLDNDTTNFPTVIDNEDEVMASHVNALADAVVALETKVGIDGPFPIALTSSMLGTPDVIGSVEGVVITDIPSTSTGLFNNTVNIVVSDPVAGTSLSIPITFPVSPIPDRLNVNIRWLTGAPPLDDFSISLGFLSASGDLSWNVIHTATAIASARPAVNIVEIDGVTTGASWNMPDLTISSAVDLKIGMRKLAPFTAIPQVQFTVEAGDISLQDCVKATTFSISPSSGTISPAWVGEDFVSLRLSMFFGNTIVGDATMICEIEFDNG
jgi:hypothetical protein